MGRSSSSDSTSRSSRSSRKEVKSLRNPKKDLATVLDPQIRGGKEVDPDPGIVIDIEGKSEVVAGSALVIKVEKLISLIVYTQNQKDLDLKTTVHLLVQEGPLRQL